MPNADYIKHDVLFAMDLLVAGRASNNERLLMRATLNVLEMLYRNVTNQISASRRQEDSQKGCTLRAA